MKSSEFLPSAPPSYLESEGQSNSYSNVQRREVLASYGAVSQARGSLQENTTVVFSERPQPQPIILQPQVEVTNRTIIQPVLIDPVFGPESCYAFCFACQTRVKTKTKKSYPCKAHLCCCLMFMSVGLLLCSPMAYCFCHPYKVTHFCPHCNAVMGVFYSNA